MNRKSLKLLLLVMPLTMTNCGDDKVQKEVLSSDVAQVTRRNIALPKTVKTPSNNPSSFEKEQLGKLLFFDPILSGGKDVACATCHHPENGYAEFRDLSIGPNAHGLGSKRKFNLGNQIPFVQRNSQTIINSAYNGMNMNAEYTPETAPMFWDERAKSLEKQALEPIKAFEEMRGPDFTEAEILDEVVRRLKNSDEYQILFSKAFGNENAITVENLGKAIASFERTIVANNSRFDQYMRGDSRAITLSEKEGFTLFNTVGCINCHKGPMFSDYQPHVLGVPDNGKLRKPDTGMQDSFQFRTPTLRNLRFTPPYMHNGSLPTLRRVLEFYEDISNGKERNPLVSKQQYDPFIKDLKLSVKEMSLIISFLNTLNDDTFSKDIPESVPSGLPVGGNIH